MPMYNLVDCSNNYAKTSRILYQYCIDEPALNDDAAIVGFDDDNNTTGLLFKFKEKITGQTGNNGAKKSRNSYRNKLFE